MRPKKRLMLTLAAASLVLALLNVALLLVLKSPPLLTGEAVSSTAGITSICINHPPSIAVIPDQSATVDTVFTLQISGSDNDSNTITYQDNTSLFAINSSGYISFTPLIASVGTYSILITAIDNSACSNNNSTRSFQLSIAEAVGGGAPASGGVGGGAGGGTVIPKEVIKTSLSSQSVDLGLTKQNLVYFTWFGITHTIGVTSLDDETMSLLVSSTPKVLTLSIGESSEIDIDDDGIVDIAILLRSINEGVGSIRITVLREGILLSDDVVKASIRQSQIFEKKIVVVQDWMSEVRIDLANSLERILTADPLLFTLPPRGKQPVLLIFNSARDAPLGVYSGKLSITGAAENGIFEKNIALIIEVESDSVLLDGSLDLREKTIPPGGELRAAVSVFNLLEVPLNNVSLIYEIIDGNNKMVYVEEEAVSLEKQASFTKTISLPEELKPGDYVFSLKMVSGESFATATELFNIAGVPPAGAQALVGRAAAAVGGPAVLASFVGIFLVVIIILSYQFFLYGRDRREKTVVVPRTIIQRTEVVREDSAAVRRKLSMLREGYLQGYISRGAYNKGKEKLSALLFPRRK